MTAVDAQFNRADINHDGSIDQNEFRQFVGSGGSAYGGAAGGYGAYQSSSFESSGYGAGGLGGGAAYGVGLGGGAAYGVGLGDGLAGASTYESSSYQSTGYGADGLAGGAYGVGGGAAYGVGGGVGIGGVSSYESSSYSSGVGGAGGAVGYGVDVAGGYGSESVAVQRWATDAQGLFQDSNPQIIRRPAPGGPATYTQNIRVRFLQPPPIPPPGPLIIKEVRPPQPPVLAPLRIRQQAPPLPSPPPLVLRERPPPVPQSLATQTVIRRLAALPVPPRSVIIERLPPLPPRPRDIIIERWIPYGAQAKRRTIVQRAGAAMQYQAPRNIIIQYEPVQVRVVRQFQRLGVQQENPASYVSRYGASLLDAATLIAHARAAGVVEDITAPAVGFSSAAYGQESVSGSFGGGFETGGIIGGGSQLGYSEYGATSLGIGAAGIDTGAVALGGGYGELQGGASTFESSGSSFVSSGASGNLTYPIGVDVGVGGFVANPAAYERFQAAGTAEQHGYSVGGDVAIGAPDLAQRVNRYDAAGAMFNFADINHDGRIDRNEFGNFIRSV